MRLYCCVMSHVVRIAETIDTMSLLWMWHMVHTASQNLQTDKTVRLHYNGQIRTTSKSAVLLQNSIAVCILYILHYVKLFFNWCPFDCKRRFDINSSTVGNHHVRLWPIAGVFRCVLNLPHNVLQTIPANHDDSYHKMTQKQCVDDSL